MIRKPDIWDLEMRYLQFMTMKDKVNLSMGGMAGMRGDVFRI